MTISKINNLIQLLKEYNQYFFSGKDKAIIDLIYDADGHIIGIIDTFFDDKKDEMMTTEDLKDFLKDELS